jgi:cysteinyl-tRNA synthetase
MRILDTLTGEKREFTPVADLVRLYVCGVTPYAPAHVGHAMSYIVFDVVRRYLEYSGYRVRHVQNFTDIDDKLILRAQQRQTAVEALAQGYIDSYLQEMADLNVLPAHEYPRATREIPAMIGIIVALVEKGFAYPADGDVYFRVTRGPDYGKLSQRSLEGMRAGARVELGEAKEHPMDFTLWKAAKPDEPQWDSPWGPGRPGWHIECTAMALGYLGETIDIHGGGQDLMFPHHENEIAQSEAYTGQQPFVQFWMHNGLLQLDQQKMSKSLGNLVTIRDALSRFPADALRMALLSSHYRSPTSYSDAAMEASQRAIARLRQAATIQQGAESTASGPLDPSPYRERFLAAMDDDFNTPQALAVLFDLARDTNRAAEEGQGVAQAQELLLELGQRVLGFTFQAEEFPVPAELGARIQELVERRTELRGARDFAAADSVRDELARLNVTLTDSTTGTTWHWGGPASDSKSPS